MISCSSSLLLPHIHVSFCFFDSFDQLTRTYALEARRYNILIEGVEEAIEGVEEARGSMNVGQKQRRIIE